jgi:hypothetical protein
MTKQTDAELAEKLRRVADALDTMDFDEEAVDARLAAQRLEAREEVSEATQQVLSAEQKFRDSMGPEWEGDPLTDACDRLRAALEAASASQ